MNGNNQALLIGNRDSVVHAVERRFLALGLPSLSISDASEAVDVIREGRVVTFLAIDEAIGESAASDVLTAAKTLYPEAPVLWVGADRGPERFVYAPDAIISPLSKPNDAERAGEQLLRAVFYPNVLVDAFQHSLQTVLQGSFDVHAKIDDVYLRSNRNVLAFVNTLLPFAGKKVSGRLAVSSSLLYLKSVHKRIFGGDVPATIDDAEDIAAEMCNQTLGTLKVFLARRGITIESGLPMMIRGQQAEIRYKATHPALVFRLEEPQGTLFFEAYFDIFNVAELSRPIDGDFVKPGVVTTL
jgi:CheY-specific phosphatase CheX